MSIVKLKKDELKLVAEEMGFTVPMDAKRVDLKRLIEESDVYKEDYEFVKTVIEQAELELAQLRTNASNSETSFNGGETEMSIDVFIKSVRTLTIKVPSKSEEWGFFFTSLERAYSNNNVLERFRAEILLNLLEERASNILTYITEKELNNYKEIKSIILREFEPTAHAVLENFRNACRENETHVQFALRLTTNFKYYLKLRKVTDFDTLKELIESDKMFQTLDRETAAHINIRQSEDWFRPLQLGKEWDLYFTSSGKPVIETRKDHNYSKLKPFKTAPKVFFNEEKKNCDLCLRNQEYQKLYREFLKELTELTKWHHVPPEQNSTDIISRELDPGRIQRSVWWWFGPAFLEVSSVNFPRYVDETHNCKHYQRELKDNQVESMCFLGQNREILPIIDRCSSFLKLQRILAWCVRFKQMQEIHYR
ncbi:DUF1758 domain-containing protein [Trichonephila clavipes]|uniref:DUF1758 domain-containing protein n=1 Tax=Trichonephila clavipes TaxID=2585209 RepID=A0A8X6W6H6_TRICX|nr:DUF1758 domain-containing protein [Trichonephila clavipes]